MALHMTSTGINYANAQTVTGATGASVSTQILDHYEEGTWTPAWYTGTTAGGTSKGTYIRIGTQVSFNMYMTKYLSAGDTYQISGLPFTSVSTTNTYSSIYFGQLHYINFSSIALPTGYVNPNQSVKVLYWAQNDAAQAAWTGSTVDHSSLGLMVGGHYNAA